MIPLVIVALAYGVVGYIYGGARMLYEQRPKMAAWYMLFAAFYVISLVVFCLASC